MSVIGIDYGNLDCVIAQAKRGGIDIVLNENSNRKNPNMVCMQAQQRLIGEAAVSVARMHYKNCATDIKLLIGKKFDSADAQRIIQTLPYKCIKLAEDGNVGIVLTYASEEVTFRCEQIVAMVLSKLQWVISNSNAESGGNVTSKSDIVISVPGFFNDAQRRAMLDATKIAGFTCLRLMNEHAAVALAFGIYKSARNLFHETDIQHVMFIDMGHASYTVSIVAYVQGKLTVKAVVYDSSLGGRDFDLALANHVNEEFKSKTKKDAMAAPKSRLKLLAAAEKTKKNLSPNGVSASNLNVECLVEESDYNGRVELTTFEEIIEPLLARLEGPVLQALAQANVDKTTLTSIEIVGGGTRVSSVKKRLSDILALDQSKNNFGLSTTLNADESVARGCALQCAMLSPLFKVKEFQIQDIVSLPVRVSWDAVANASAVSSDAMDTTEDGEDAAVDASTQDDLNSLLIFNKTDDFPKTRRITFRRSDDFDVRAAYDEPSVEGILSSDVSRDLGSYTISNIPKVAEGEEIPRISVNVRVDIHGIFMVSSGNLMQEIKEEVVAPVVAPATVPAVVEPTTTTDTNVPPPAASDATTEGSEKESEKKEDMSTKTEEKTVTPVAKKKRYRKIALKVSSKVNFGLSASAITAANEKELTMAQSDRIIEETANKRNELESYIYDTRNAMIENLKSFLQDSEKSNIENELQTAEDWLYSDEGFDSTKSVYTTKLADLTALTKPIEFRMAEAEARPLAQADLLSLVEEYKKLANSTEGAYDHWNDADREILRKNATDTESWLYDELPKQSDLAANQNPILLAQTIRTKASGLRDMCRATLQKPKPKVVKKEEPVKAEGETEGKEGEEKKGADEMDLD